ncbi:MAG: hypothetical protein E7262_04390 [Lachnospiraceae bacterium]|nr:hypothetical protein [Lachnospiraceae bacterium]
MAIRMSGMVSGLDTEAIIQSLMEVQTTRKTKVENNKTKLEWKQEKWQDLHNKIYKMYTGSLSNLRLESAFNTKKASSNNDSKVKVTADSKAVNGSNTLKINELATSQYVTSAQKEDLKASTTLESIGFRLPSTDEDGNPVEGDVITIKNGTGDDAKTVELKVTKDTKVSDFVNSLKEAGLTASFDEKQGRFFISSTNSGKENAFTITTNHSEDSSLQHLGLAEIDENAVDIEGGEGMAIITAKDSEIIFNGAKLTHSTNSVTVNGISLELQGKTTGDEVINIQVSNDITSTYDMVKDYIKEYNELLKEMNALYYAESARDYDILTSEEEEAMSDEDVEKWNDKIKGALLRRDSTLGRLLNAMKTTLHTSVEVDGKKYSLASFGISTSSDYTERGLLHLWGDEDDEYGSTQDDKLKAALEENPDVVGKALSQIFKNMYDSLTEKTKAIDGLKSAMKFYNDKQLTKELEGYTQDISDWEKKLSNMEERYYDQFTSMEVALSKLQNQSNSLSSFMPQ